MNIFIVHDIFKKRIKKKNDGKRSIVGPISIAQCEIWSKCLGLSKSFFFFLINKESNWIKKSCQKSDSRYTWNKPLTTKAQTRIVLTSTRPFKKLIKVSGQSSINNSDSNQRKQTKSLFNIWKENISLSNAILFLAFQTVQNKHKGLAFQTFLCFLSTKESCHPSKGSLTNEDSIQDTPKSVKSSSHLVYSQWRSRWYMESSRTRQPSLSLNLIQS